MLRIIEVKYRTKKRVYLVGLCHVHVHIAYVVQSLNLGA